MTTKSKASYRTLGGKKYELSNHLGNVLAVVSDNIHLDQDSTWASVVNVTYYYPFGLAMGCRSVLDSSCRYGFNGKEEDDEIKGSGNSLDFGARIYDPRLGRFLSVDPMAHLREWVSPYNFVQNNPIMRTDPTGAFYGEYDVTHDENGNEVKTKTSTLGDAEGIDFNHHLDGAQKGNTEIVNNNTGQQIGYMVVLD